MANDHIELNALSALFPHQVARTADLIDLGLTGASVKRRCSPGGPWRTLLPGVVLLTDTAPTRRQLVQAALRYAGKDAVVTGQDALALHGVLAAYPRGRVHLLVPGSQTIRSGADILVERTPAPPRPVLRHGLLTAPLARAAVDSARRMQTRAMVSALFSEVVFQGGVRLDELNAEIVVGGRRGAGLPRQVLHEIGTRIRAAVATSARELIVRAGLPPPRWNVPVDDAMGNPLGTVTGSWEDIKVAWDVHAFDFDPAPASYPIALKRGSRLAASGHLVLHTPATQIQSNPKGVIAELRAMLDQALARTA
ncbi:hypothetical protein JOF56_000054 [Kibdelosporangium banguiense]|uniref:Uncharacterized protein n=1 Tax=Kibdelosporangium banguiense TaxID=1365924 RepID=A0ABS4T5C3_9PSEU|nr:hypothetical protein [Kibdelosporangium banguiense]MBP2319669.1 hypothetical protein [Kibdelosporangium banguiense]